jgi:zinc transport system permease protein
MDLLQFDFMRRALEAGVLIGLACSALGVFLVLRREALIGHGLADVAFGGIAAGLLLSIDPFWGALAAALACSLWIIRARRSGLSDDTSIGIVANAGLALGIVLVSLSGNFTVQLFSTLFGSILAITPGEVAACALLAAVVLGAVAWRYHDLVALAFDRDMALTSGVRAGRLEVLLAVLTAVTVVLAMKVVGVLLVSALIVMPAAAVLPFAPSFRAAVLSAMAVGVLGTGGGIVLAWHLDIPAAGAVVLVLLLLFLAPRALRRLGLLHRPVGG